MSRARTYTKSEISDAAEAAAIHGVRVVMHPNGVIEFAPKGFAAHQLDDDSPEDVLRRWENGRQARGRA